MIRLKEQSKHSQLDTNVPNVPMRRFVVVLMFVVLSGSREIATPHLARGSFAILRTSIASHTNTIANAVPTLIFYVDMECSIACCLQQRQLAYSAIFAVYKSQY